ncbi:uncharacterized protein [Spinacia oleracea]|uniref:Uncharacterized protein isoform X2 n=1 Tax=Spinacia oleracea TaxID=3562 RepID=A0A9R0I0M5_SPIOL|nr:uncharacterized protein LOC110780388 isoform X2 [Spinacia oleracea]
MKMNNQASKSHLMKNDFYIIDDLLLQILFRLPCSESVIRCKCVSKQWCKVISEPGFDAEFIAHKINNSQLSSSKNEEQLPSIFGLRRYNKKPFIYPTHPTFTNLDFSLSFIPTYEQGPEYRIVVKASCSDLVVCISPSPKDLYLYVCNPRTKQYFQLPPPSQKKHPALIGFTCDPFYVFDKEADQVTLSTCFRFSVCYAFFARAKADRLEIEIFSSENRVWRKAILLTPQYFDYNYATLKNCFTYKEILHFYSDCAIIGFDPYKINEDGEIHTHFIQMPPFDATANRGVCIGVFGGKILVAELCARYVHPRQLINTAQTLSSLNILCEDVPTRRFYFSIQTMLILCC